MTNTKIKMAGLGLCVGALAACSVDTGESTVRDAEQNASLDDEAQFYAPPPQEGAIRQIVDLIRHRELKDAKRIFKMVTTPQAVWLEQGNPKEVAKQAKKESKRAAKLGKLPVFVAYNIPFRDCAQFSAGGATSVDEYLAWIDGVVEGIGERDAVVILEPDGLGIIPYFTNPFSGQYDWCQPAEADPDTAAADRFFMMNEAVARLKTNPNTIVYLDGTHSGWIGVGEMGSRLVQGGLLAADGFFLNASNYRAQRELENYGKYISSCVELTKATGWWDPLWCEGQYSPPNYELDWSQEWVEHLDAYFEQQLADLAGGVTPSTHFVIDTSRNGQGPWTTTDAPDGADIQDWCNPPNRGLGLRPSTHTSSDLIDAYLWIKTPGESDGECNRWEPVGSPDPIRGYVNPSAGDWFPEQAIELTRLADPKL